MSWSLCLFVIWCTFSVLIGTLHSLHGPVSLCFPPRRAQQKAELKQSLVANMCNRSQLEQEVIHLKKEVTRLKHELADTQKVFKGWISADLSSNLEIDRLFSTFSLLTFEFSRLIYRPKCCVCWSSWRFNWSSQRGVVSPPPRAPHTPPLMRLSRDCLAETNCLAIN